MNLHKNGKVPQPTASESLSEHIWATGDRKAFFPNTFHVEPQLSTETTQRVYKKTEKCLAQPPHGLHSRSCLRWDLPTIKRLVWPYIRVGSLVLDGVCLWGGKGATTVACAIQPLHALQIIQDGVFSIYYPLSIQFSLVMKNDKYISYPLIYPHSY